MTLSHPPVKRETSFGKKLKKWDRHPLLTVKVKNYGHQCLVRNTESLRGAGRAVAEWGGRARRWEQDGDKAVSSDPTDNPQRAGLQLPAFILKRGF